MTEEIISKTANYIREKLSGESSGHDWWHIYRVWNLGKKIAISEKADLDIVELSCLLHDISDWKFNGGNDNIGPKLAQDWLQKIDVDYKIIYPVCRIIKDISFKGANVKNPLLTLEGKCVQDADRLDAIGAIGIARTFAYGGYSGREIYNPDIKPKRHNSFEEYKKNQSPIINHFYEKLLLLKDKMNTDTGKRLSEERHTFMESFLKQFFNEWEGKI